jgi:hypothetical protein
MSLTRLMNTRFGPYKEENIKVHNIMREDKALIIIGRGLTCRSIINTTLTCYRNHNTVV